jgi:phage gp36-like protein
MSQPLAITLRASGAATAAGSGTAVDLGLVSEADGAPARSAARLLITVSAYADVERVRLVVEHSAAEGGPWLELGEVDLVQTGEADLSVADSKRWVRARWEFFGAGGSASITFGVEGNAHQVYCGPRGLGRFGITRAVIDDLLTKHAQADGCITASDEADGYLGGRYTLPMLAWCSDLEAMVARMAVKYGFDVNGWQPDGPADMVMANFNHAIGWLKRLQDGKLEPPGMKDSTPEVFEGGSVVVSRPRRSAL